MADENTTQESVKSIPRVLLCGRRDILSAVSEITEKNVIAEVNSALVYHLQNVAEEEYLYWYRRGLQPVLNRTKTRNEYVNNKVVCNIAEQVCTFKNGYFLMQPTSYISRKPGKKNKVDKLNEYMYRSGKPAADNALADWFHTVGKAALYVEPTDDPDVPLKAYAVDPRSAFVVYSMRPGNKPLFGVNVVINEDNAAIDVYTTDKIFRLRGSATGRETTDYADYCVTAISVEGEERNRLSPYIPIIEYRYNSMNEGSFEMVCDLCDSYNNLLSDRMDGVDQFIQSIAIAVNCQFEEGTTANKIKEAGMIALTSIGENKADFKILSEELNQEQSQTLADSIYDQILQICSMPSSAKNGRGTYDSTGAAAIFNNGWQQASSAARNTEDLFKVSNRYFDEILTFVLRKKRILDIALVDFELNFVRNETANMQSKAQAFQTLLAAGLHPELALAKSGISNDPVSDLKMSEKYMKMVWGDPDAAAKKEETGNPDGEAEIIEETPDTIEE